MQGIYKIESPSGSFYIGSSINVSRRIKTHKRDLLFGRHINTALRNAAKKYGVDNLVFSEIVCVMNRSDLLFVEQQLIEELKPEYNISQNAYCSLFDAGVVSKRIASLSKPVVRMTDGMIFPSGYQAAKHHGCKSADNISTAIRKGWKFAGHFWKFQGESITIEEIQKRWDDAEANRKLNASKAAAKSRSKKVKRLSDGMIFSSASEASRYIGGHPKMVSEAISLGVKRGGSRWEYV